MDNSLPFPAQTPQIVSRALEEGVATLFTRFGVTTVGEISETIEGIEAMDRLAQQRRLGTRIRAYL